MQELGFMDTIDIYRRAIKRTFAGLYRVAPDEVDVSWSANGDNITVRCADKTFTKLSMTMMSPRSNLSEIMLSPSD